MAGREDFPSGDLETGLAHLFYWRMLLYVAILASLVPRSANLNYAKSVKNGKNFIFRHISVAPVPHADDLGANIFIWKLSGKGSTLLSRISRSCFLETLLKWFEQHVSGAAIWIMLCAGNFSYATILGRHVRFKRKTSRMLDHLIALKRAKNFVKFFRFTQK